MLDNYDEIKSRWSKLEPLRQSLEKVWQDCSALTLPYLFPVSGNTESSDLPTPYNSIGAASVNTLASKLLLALLPPTGNFFRLLPYMENTKDMTEEQLKVLDVELAKLEQDANEYVNIHAMRVPLYEAIKLLITIGNALVYKIKGGGLKVFNPYQYVIQRDYSGNIVEIVIKETIAKELLPPEVLEQLEAKVKEVAEDMDIYTRIVRLSTDKWESYQEVEGVIIETSKVAYTNNTMPYIPLRWNSVYNSDYGKGLVEQYIGDLRSLEGLTQMLVEDSGVMAKTIFGLKPASSTSLDDIQDALNGDFITGDLEKDVTVLRVGKGADLQIPFNMMGVLENRLARAFLTVQGAVRDSERTTATEARMTANELEAALGGTYSVLAQDLQLPLLRLILEDMEPRALKIAEPSIVTGLSAISRERDFQNYNTMLQAVSQLGPEAVQRYFKISSYLSGVATALGLPAEELIKTQEELQQEQMAIQQMQAQAQQQSQAGGVQ